MKQLRTAITDETLFNSVDAWKEYLKKEISIQTGLPHHRIHYSTYSMRAHVKRFSDQVMCEIPELIHFRTNKNWEVMYYFLGVEWKFQAISIEDFIISIERNNKLNKLKKIIKIK